jgi:hypothetical protein
MGWGGQMPPPSHSTIVEAAGSGNWDLVRLWTHRINQHSLTTSGDRGTGRRLAAAADSAVGCLHEGHAESSGQARSQADGSGDGGYQDQRRERQTGTQQEVARRPGVGGNGFRSTGLAHGKLPENTAFGNATFPNQASCRTAKILNIIDR